MAGLTTSVGPQLEEEIAKAGLKMLRDKLGVDNLLQFPKRPNGTPILMRESFFERMFNGKMELMDFPATDVNAAQVDLKNLNIEQLLHIRVENRHFQQAPALRTQAEFLAQVDSLLEKRISERLSESGGAAWSQSNIIGDVVRLVLLIYGVHYGLSANEDLVAAQSQCDLWLFRVGNLDAFLCISTCRLQRLQASGSDNNAPQQAWCRRIMSRSGPGIAKEKRKLHWEVELSDSPLEFVESAGNSDVADKRASRRAAFQQKLVNGEKVAGIAVNDVQAAAMERRAAAEPKMQEAMERIRILEAEAAASEKMHSAAVAKLEEQLAQLRVSVETAETRAKTAEEELEQQRALVESAETRAKAAEEQLEQQRSLVESAEARAKTSEDLVAQLQEQLEQQSVVAESLEKAETKCKAADDLSAQLQEQLDQQRVLAESAETRAGAAEDLVAEAATRELQQQEQLEQQRVVAESAETRAKAAEDLAEQLQEQLEQQKALVETAETKVKAAEEQLEEQRAAVEKIEDEAKAKSPEDLQFVYLPNLQEQLEQQRVVIETAQATAKEAEEQLEQQRSLIEAAESKAKTAQDFAGQLQEQLKQQRELVETAENKAKTAEDSAARLQEQLEQQGVSDVSERFGYPVGAVVEYYSKSADSWILARVNARRLDGLYDLDCKAGVSHDKLRVATKQPSTSSGADIVATVASSGESKPNGIHDEQLEQQRALVETAETKAKAAEDHAAQLQEQLEQQRALVEIAETKATTAENLAAQLQEQLGQQQLHGDAFSEKIQGLIETAETKANAVGDLDAKMQELREENASLRRQLSSEAKARESNRVVEWCQQKNAPAEEQKKVTEGKPVKKEEAKDRSVAQKSEEGADVVEAKDTGSSTFDPVSRNTEKADTAEAKSTEST